MIFCLGWWLGQCEKNRLKVHQSLLENFSVRAKQKNKKPVAHFMKLQRRHWRRNFCHNFNIGAVLLGLVLLATSHQ